MTLRAVPPIITDETRLQAYDVAAERRRRIDAIRVDRSKVPAEKFLKPSPPEARRVDEWMRLWRERHPATKLEVLRAWWLRAKRAGEIPREPMPVR